MSPCAQNHKYLLSDCPISLQLKAIIRLGCLISLLFAVALLPPPHLAAQVRGVSVIDETGREVVRYQKSYALLIGMSRYTSGWSDLGSVPGELDQVGDMLEAQGFSKVVKRLDLDSIELRRIFETFISDYGFESDNRLFFFFSGHGHTLKGPWGRESGYIVPVDAPDPRADLKGFKSKAVEMEQIRTWVSKLDARHVLFLFDSCFSGTVFTYKSGKDMPPAIADATSEPVRQFITAGKARRQVPARSVFTPAFVDAIKRRKGDLNGDNYITGSELAMHLKDEVPRYVKQNPQEGCIGGYSMCQGDFVFALPKQEDKYQQIPATLAIESNVAGARVLIDGREVGSTNLENIEITSGEHEIRVEKGGYEPYIRQVRFADGRTVALYVDLRRIGPSKGRLYVDTEPEGARVRVLNIKPKYFRGMELDPGSYHLELSAKGYKTERHWITFSAGYEAPFKFKLTKLTTAKPPPLPEVITNSIGMKFVLIPAGSFAMGSRISPEEVSKRYGGKAEWYKSERPLHEVRLGKSFYLQTTEVTQGQWREIMGTNPSYFKDCGENCPVESVSWEDAHKFISKLNQKEGTDKYRLPTEAEWEYACRSGTTTLFSFGDDADKLDDYGWYSRNSNERTHPTATLKSNSWGLYDMLGNVWEWVEDDWHDPYEGAPTDGRAWVNDPRNTYRVFRGGAYDDGPSFARCAARVADVPDLRDDGLGFRCARTIQ